MSIVQNNTLYLRGSLDDRILNRVNFTFNNNMKVGSEIKLEKSTENHNLSHQKKIMKVIIKYKNIEMDSLTGIFQLFL